MDKGSVSLNTSAKSDMKSKFSLKVDLSKVKKKRAANALVKQPSVFEQVNITFSNYHMIGMYFKDQTLHQSALTCD